MLAKFQNRLELPTRLKYLPSIKTLTSTFCVTDIEKIT